MPGCRLIGDSLQNWHSKGTTELQQMEKLPDGNLSRDACSNILDGVELALEA